MPHPKLTRFAFLVLSLFLLLAAGCGRTLTQPTSGRPPPEALVTRAPLSEPRIPLLTIVSQDTDPVLMGYIKPSVRPLAYFEVPPPMFPGGWRQFFLTVGETWQCPAPQDQLINIVMFTSAWCALVVRAESAVNNPDNIPSGTAWRRNYEGVYSILFLANGSDRRILAITHGENLNQCRWHEANGAAFPDSRYYRYQNTMNPSVKVTDCYRPATPDNCYGDCWAAYHGFVNMAWIANDALNNWGIAAFASAGPIVWPEAGYVSPSGVRLSGGVRHPSALITNGFIYVYYVDESPNNLGIKVARAAVSGNGEPGTYKVFAQSCPTNEPFCLSALPAGLTKHNVEEMKSAPGPRGTAIVGWGVTRFSVAAVRGTSPQMYVSVEEFNDAVGWHLRMRSSLDLIRWSAPVSLLDRVGGWNNGDVHYPMFLDKSGWDNTNIDLDEFFVVGTKWSENNPDGGEQQFWPVKLRVSAQLHALR